MKPTKEVIEKIRKCLALANDRNASEGEIWNAVARAKEIAMRHGIDISQVGPSEEKKPTEVVIDKDNHINAIYRQPYHKWVFKVLEDVFEIKVIWNHTSTSGGVIINYITFIGDATDVAIAKVMFKWLEKKFPAALSKKVSQGILTYKAAHTNGFYLGFCIGIIRANQRKEKEVKESLPAEQANQFALMVVKKEEAIDKVLKEKYPKLKTARNTRQQLSSEAAYYGEAEGLQVNLRQVGSGTPASQLR